MTAAKRPNRRARVRRPGDTSSTVLWHQAASAATATRKAIVPRVTLRPLDIERGFGADERATGS
jgi:hypothetical protein